MIDIYDTNKYIIRIYLCAWLTTDKNLAPTPMRCGPAAVKQTGSRQQHLAGTHRSDSPNPSGEGLQPADYLSVYFIILNRAAAGYEQSVDVSAQLAKRLVGHDPQTAIRDN